MQAFMIRNKESGEYLTPNYVGKNTWFRRQDAVRAIKYHNNKCDTIDYVLPDYEVVIFDLIEVSKGEI